MKIQISNWTFSQAMSVDLLQAAVSKLHGLQMTAARSVEIIREAIDKRQKQLKYVYTVVVTLPETIAPEDLQKKNKGLYFKGLHEGPVPTEIFASSKLSGKRVLVVGSGPAGLFAAHALSLAQAQVTLVERGAPVEERGKQVQSLFKRGEFNPASNICFGEGGAGTYSDGKLTTRKNHPWIRWIFQQFVDCGAPEEIMSSYRPHIGTDVLETMTIRFRKRLINQGVRVIFNTCVDRLSVKHGKVQQVYSADQLLMEAPDAVIWATGHSARDSLQLLYDLGVPMSPKAFAVGFRIEHPQALVNRWMDGPSSSSCAADYSFSHNFSPTRGIYSFCMCPGGQVVCSSSEPGMHVVNGMSNYARNSAFANAGLVCKVDIADFASEHPLAGAEFQSKIEKMAFSLAGNSYAGPAQRVCDFSAGRSSQHLSPSSYEPSLVSADLHRLYPEELNNLFKSSLDIFEKRFPGFAGPDAMLIGSETRTSSPVRIHRDDAGASPAINNFYPCGEGAGYAGGIVSAALDGLFIAGRIRSALL